MSHDATKEIAIREEFDGEQWDNWTAPYSLPQHIAVEQQKHLDIRTFHSDDVVTQITMLHLDLLEQTYLSNVVTMEDLEGNVVVGHAENWTQGSVGRKSDLNNWRGIDLTCGVGTTVTSSTIPTASGEFEG